MTYEQSLQNIENIKNFVLPYGNQVVVFDFQNVNSFQVVFYSNYTDQLNDTLRADALNRNCAYARIKNSEYDFPVLAYIDNNLMITYNLELNEIVHFEKIENIDLNKLKKDFTGLVKFLENI